jgi:hypothetical protein
LLDCWIAGVIRLLRQPMAFSHSGTLKLNCTLDFTNPLAEILLSNNDYTYQRLNKSTFHS